MRIVTQHMHADAVPRVTDRPSIRSPGRIAGARALPCSLRPACTPSLSPLSRARVSGDGAPLPRPLPLPPSQFLQWITSLLNGSDPSVPNVHSVSYGDVESSLDPAYVSRVNAEFQKIGAAGKTLVFASGDDGGESTCTQQCSCLWHDHLAREKERETHTDRQTDSEAVKCTSR